jgi:STE24 endopeptidase
VVVATLVVAEATVLLMRPRDRIEPAEVDARAYFSPAQIERAEDFRGGQRALYGLRLVITFGVLIVAVRNPPRWLGRRPVRAAAATGATLAVALTVATMPVSIAARERAKDVGLVTQDWVGYAGDVVKSTGIEAVLWAAGGALLVVGMRRFGRNWWAPAAALVVAFGVGMTYVSPIVLDPLFNRFTPLPAGELRSSVLELGQRAGVQIGEVYEMDASRRTTAANAYVAGLGATKRVVLYDTLLKDFTPAEVRGVVAHELGHVRFHDVPRGLLYLAIVAPFGMLAAARLGERFAGRTEAATVPAVVLALSIMAPAVSIVSNQLSRAVEARADRYAMELTDDPHALIEFQRRITVQNVSDPDPPGWAAFLLGTHPTPVERIGQALAFERR